MPQPSPLKPAGRPAVPWGECLGVMLGALAWDWLADGRASVWRAAALAIGCGGAIYAFRLCQKSKNLAEQESEPGE